MAATRTVQDKALPLGSAWGRVGCGPEVFVDPATLTQLVASLPPEKLAALLKQAMRTKPRPKS